jgi:hypothetical protein
LDFWQITEHFKLFWGLCFGQFAFFWCVRMHNYPIPGKRR